MSEFKEENKISANLYNPTKHQKIIHHFCSDAHPAKIILSIAGRQSGKSYCAMYQVIYWLLSNPNCGIMWISKSNSQAQYVFLKLLNALTDAGLVVKKNQGVSSMYIETIGGSTVYVRSAMSEDSLRGYSSISKIVMDEASFMPSQIFSEIVLPFLNTKKGNITNKILIATTPKGRLNWVYAEYKKIGVDPDYAGIRWTVYDNPNIDKTMIELARRNSSERVFNQEYLAMWSDSSSMYNNVIDCASIPNIQTEPIPNERYIMSVDPGLVNDFTSITIMNLKGMVVYIERFRRVTASALKKKIVDLVNKWKPMKTIVESTGIGKPICSDLKHEHNIHIEEWNTSQTSKEIIVESLANAFDNFAIRIPKNPDYLIKELMDFTAYPTVRGKIRYESASGNDDAVMSLAICHFFYKKYSKSGGRYVVK